jgi:rSAM/selenodomain-associated transferase 1
MHKSLRQDEARLSSCGIAVMAKASIPGRTKTRLVPPLSFEEAAAFNTAFLQDVAANILAASARANIAGYMAFGPPEAASFFRDTLPPGIGLIECLWPDFGDCLFKTIGTLLERGHTAAVVLNSDSPTLPTSLLAETARLLARPGDRFVIGPSTDGGYYLLGLKLPHRRLFDDIDWSTERVFRQTLARAAEISLPVHVLPPWYDVDEADALRLLYSELCEGRGFAAELTSHPALHSRELIRRFMAQHTDKWAAILRRPNSPGQQARPGARPEGAIAKAG